MNLLTHLIEKILGALNTSLKPSTFTGKFKRGDCVMKINSGKVEYGKITQVIPEKECYAVHWNYYYGETIEKEENLLLGER